MTTEIRSHRANPDPGHQTGDRADPGRQGKRPYRPPCLQKFGRLIGVTCGSGNDPSDEINAASRVG